MELEVGKLYLTRDGKREKIIEKIQGNTVWPYFGSSKNTYRIDGTYSIIIGETSNNDLIKELTPEEYPEYYI